MKIQSVIVIHNRSFDWKKEKDVIWVVRNSNKLADNQKHHFLRGLGVLIIGITLLVYSLLLIDTLVFITSLNTWGSPSDPPYNVLKQSLFWIQYVPICKLISPNIVGIIIWKFGGIMLGIGLGVFQKNSTLGGKNLRVRIKWSLSIIQLFSTTSLLSLYAIHYERFIILFPYSLLLVLPFIIFPFLLYFLSIRLIEDDNWKKTSSFLIGIIIIDIITFIFPFYFALAGCLM